MLAAIPQLRAFAVSLCRNRDHADDLVQQTLLRACDNMAKFAPGTDMRAGLITILRNQKIKTASKRATKPYYADVRPGQSCVGSRLFEMRPKRRGDNFGKS